MPHSINQATVSPSRRRMSLRECDDWRALSIARRHMPVQPVNGRSRVVRATEIERIEQHGIEGIHLYVG